MTNNLNPKFAKISSIKKVNSNLAIFKLDQEASFKPGQFFMLGIPGFGEGAFTPTNLNGKLTFLINKVGNLTNKFFTLNAQGEITFRGPYGNGFPLDKFTKQNINLIAGGCGIAPLMPALYYLNKNINKYRQIQLFYGIRNQNYFAFKEEIKNLKNIGSLVSHSEPYKNSSCNIGFVDSLIDKSTIQKNSIAILCGPPVMYDSVIKKLLAIGLDEKDIYLQIERKVSCAVGICHHCTCGPFHICKDGPLFTLKQINDNNIKL